MAYGLFFIAHFQQTVAALHQVADNHHRFHGKGPVLVFLLTVLALALTVEGGHGHAREQRTVFVIVVALVGFAVLLHPGHGFGKLLLVVDAEIHATEYLYQRYILGAHAKVLLQEVGIHNRTGDSHTGIAQTQVTLASHRGHRLGGTRKAQYFLCHILGDGIIVEILHVMAVDAIGRQPLLGMGGQHGSQIDGSRTLRTIETPHGFRIVGIHVHRLRAVAPTRGHGNRRSHALALELLGTGGTLTYPADGRVRDDTLNLRSIAISQILLD